MLAPATNSNFFSGNHVPETGPQEKRVLSRKARVIGGLPADINDPLPWLVELGKAEISRGQLVYKHHCGGSIISEFWVLTAAHCLVNGSNGQALGTNVVRSGSLFFDEGGLGHDIDFYKVHESYEQYFVGPTVNDIGVVCVVQQFVFDNLRQPIALHDRSSVTYANLPVLISGWGTTNPEPNATYSHEIRKSTMLMLDKTVCDNYLSKVLYRDDVSNIGQICGYSHGRTSTCRGDSGGPVVFESHKQPPTVIGIVSWGGRVCGEKGQPEVFTDVSKYVSWIYARTGIGANTQNVTLEPNELNKWEP